MNYLEILDSVYLYGARSGLVKRFLKI